MSTLCCSLLALSARDSLGIENSANRVGTLCEITDFNPHAERRVLGTTIRMKDDRYRDERDRNERGRLGEIIEEVQQCTSVRIKCTEFGSTLIEPQNVVAYFTNGGRVAGRTDSFSGFRINGGETRQVSVCFDAATSTIERMALDY